MDDNEIDEWINNAYEQTETMFQTRIVEKLESIIRELQERVKELENANKS